MLCLRAHTCLVDNKHETVDMCCASDIDANLLCAQHSKPLQARTQGLKGRHAWQLEAADIMEILEVQDFRDNGFTLVEVKPILSHVLWWRPASAACTGACCLTSRCIANLACGEGSPGCVVGWLAVVRDSGVSGPAQQMQTCRQSKAVSPRKWPTLGQLFDSARQEGIPAAFCHTLHLCRTASQYYNK